MNQTVPSFTVQVDVAANGYIVRPPRDVRSDCYASLTEFQVFESFDALVAHLRNVLPIYPVFSGTTLTTTQPPKGKRTRI